MQLKYAIARGLYLSGAARLGRMVLGGRGAYVLMLHDAIQQRRDDLHPRSQYGLTVTELDQLLHWLRRRNIALLTPEELLRRDKVGILLTFDDGKANNYTNLLPLLEKYEAPALYFITTQHIRDPKDWLWTTERFAGYQWPDLAQIPDAIAAEYYDGMDQAQLLACDRHPLITIGAHTETHPHLTQLDAKMLQQELAASKDFLEAVLDHPINTFSYPFGEYNRTVAEAVQAVGYTHAFAINPHPVGMPRYEIPRLHVETVEPYYIASKISGLFKPPIRTLPGT